MLREGEGGWPEMGTDGLGRQQQEGGGGCCQVILSRSLNTREKRNAVCLWIKT